MEGQLLLLLKTLIISNEALRCRHLDWSTDDDDDDNNNNNNNNNNNMAKGPRFCVFKH
jgi:hypothetical protein